MKPIWILALTSLLALATVQSQAAQLQDEVRNFHQHSSQLATGGEITPQAIAALKAAGYRQIIDLRTPAEAQFDEASAAQAAGLSYVNLPTTGSLPSAEQIQRFGALLAEGKTLVHCRSGNRVGMTWALWQLSQGADLEQALAEGRAMGMKQGFEDAIRASLSEQP